MKRKRGNLKVILEGYVKDLNRQVPRFDDDEEERSISDLKELETVMCYKIPKTIRFLLSRDNGIMPDGVNTDHAVQLIHAYIRVASRCLYATIQWDDMLECLEKVRTRSFRTAPRTLTEIHTHTTDIRSESTVLSISQQSLLIIR